MGSATLRSLGVQKPWRVLLLGVGLGALPGWFRKAQAKVTAIDLDPVVLRAAQVVGQMPGAVQGLEACLKDAEADTDALRVYCCDGVEFVKAASNEVRYDLLVMDVFDGQGETPEAFLTEDFGQACASVATCCVVNLTCPVPMWEDAHHFNAPSAGKLADAFQLGFQSKAWSVRPNGMTDGHENHPVHHLRVDSLGSSAQTQEPRKCVPLWMQWPRFWVVLCIIVAIVAVSIQNILSTDASKRVHLRESVLDLSKTYAGEVARQVRSSVSSVQALEAMMKIDDAGIALENFASLAEALISTYQGISNLQLAPFGRLDCIYPLVDETQEPSRAKRPTAARGQDNRAALGLNLLLDPVRSPAALDSIVKQETAVIGPVKLLQGGVALIARRPIFTRFAPALMPDAWYQTGGHNYSRVCSKTPPDEHCSFLGPPEADGTPTYFWGFATMLGRELLSPIHLERLQSGAHRLSGLTSFHYLLTDTRADPPVEYYGRSDREAALDRPVEAMVVVEEANIRWLLQVAPRDGWPVVFADFWNQLFIVVPMTALLGVGLGVNIIIAMRKRAHQIIKLEEYRREVISRTILASISNLNLLQFPMCLLKLQDFLGLGRLIRHEDAREARKLCFIDQPQVAADLCKEEGVAFISHQWAGPHVGTTG
eukprot:g29332.t1